MEKNSQYNWKDLKVVINGKELKSIKPLVLSDKLEQTENEINYTVTLDVTKAEYLRLKKALKPFGSLETIKN